MKLQLKDVEVHDDMSEETHCFSATLYVDGIKAARISNQGMGGPNDYNWLDVAAEISFGVYIDSLPQKEIKCGSGRTIMFKPGADVVIGKIMSMPNYIVGDIYNG